MDKKLFDSYNERDSLLVIAGFPKKSETYSRDVCAVSSFTKNTITSLKEVNPQRKIVVLTMKVKGQDNIYEEDGNLIIRCLERNNVLSFFSLLSYLRRFNKAEKVLLEFEFATFGETLMTSFLAPITWIMFYMRKDIFLVIHQVVLDLGKLSGHIGVKKNSRLLSLLNLGLRFFYITLTLPTRQVIVLEEEFKNRALSFVPEDKLVVIPHGVDTKIGAKKPKITRKTLGIAQEDFVILFFGYLTWYKGADILVESLKNVRKIAGKDIKVLVAGGPSFTQSDKPFYRRFAKKLTRKIQSLPQFVFTGFVPEGEISSIFQISDLAIFPYRVMMSSSGPLSLTISHKKPFILSDKLRNFKKSADFRAAFLASGVSENQLFFDLKKDGMISKIKLNMEKTNREKLVNLSSIMSIERSYSALALTYDRILQGNEKLLLSPSFT